MPVPLKYVWSEELAWPRSFLNAEDPNISFCNQNINIQWRKALNSKYLPKHILRVCIIQKQYLLSRLWSFWGRFAAEGDSRFHENQEDWPPVRCCDLFDDCRWSSICWDELFHDSHMLLVLDPPLRVTFREEIMALWDVTRNKIVTSESFQAFWCVCVCVCALRYLVEHRIREGRLAHWASRRIASPFPQDVNRSQVPVAALYATLS